MVDEVSWTVEWGKTAVEVEELRLEVLVRAVVDDRVDLFVEGVTLVVGTRVVVSSKAFRVVLDVSVPSRSDVLRGKTPFTAVLLNVGSSSSVVAGTTLGSSCPTCRRSRGIASRLSRLLPSLARVESIMEREGVCDAKLLEYKNMNQGTREGTSSAEYPTRPTPPLSSAWKCKETLWRDGVGSKANSEVLSTGRSVDRCHGRRPSVHYDYLL